MTSWFDDARFGMFVHWNHASQRGLELSWPLVGGTPALPACQDVPVAEYFRTTATFDPRPDSPRAWAQLARRAGMQYAVLTTKHHDGWALFHSALSEHGVASSPYGGDVVGEFVAAIRAEGLRVGLYYSLSDWHHPDYPAFADAHRPYLFGRQTKPTSAQWERYLAFLHGQVRELLTAYGPIDVLWFDGGWERSPAEWRSDELRALIRALQPDCLVNDRLPGHGDFDTPEQFVPAEAPGRRWETCLTMNDSWGWNPEDGRWKSPHELVHTLCEVAGKGGNLLLNVGPMGDGTLPQPVLERLAVLERWMTRHRESIVGTRPGLAAWQFYGPTTRRDARLYLHLLMRPYEDVTVRGVPIARVRAIRSLSTGTELRWSSRAPIIDTLFNADPRGELRITVPEHALDSHATVLAIDFTSADDLLASSTGSQ
jgi:alpha-L-fucosidase